MGLSQIVHHQRLNFVFGAQLLGELMCPSDHRVGRLLAIRRVGVVGQVNKVHLRQLGAQRPQHAEAAAADAAVENANGDQRLTFRRQRPRCP
jgi:hypothetical protein